MLQIHPTESLDTITHKILLHNFDEVYQTKLFTFGKGKNALFFLHLHKKKLCVLGEEHYELLFSVMVRFSAKHLLCFLTFRCYIVFSRAVIKKFQHGFEENL